MSTTRRGAARRRTFLLALSGVLVGCALVATVLFGLVGGQAPPPEGAASVVPADAFAYVHVSTDRTRPEVRQSLALLARLPVQPAFMPALRFRFALVDRWLGREAAIAELPQGALTVAGLTDRAAARRGLIGAGGVDAGAYRGRSLLRFASGDEVAFIRHYAVIGQDPALRAAIDASAAGRTLADAEGYRRSAAGAPPDRVLDAYLSSVGLNRLLLADSGRLAGLGLLLARPTLLGVAVSLSPARGGLRVRMHSALDARISGLGGHGERTFTPSLQQVVPAGTTLMLDQLGLDRAAPGLLQAGAAAGIGSTIAPLLSRLGAALAAEGVNVPAVLSVFHGETAVALSRGAGDVPALLIISRVPDETAARARLASVELPLAHLFSSLSAGAGQAPLVNDVPLGAHDLHELSLAPGLRIDYTVARGLAIIATSRSAVVSVLQRARGLAADPVYRSVLPATPGRVRSLLFFDFNQLLNLVEQAGLTRGAGYRALRPDLQLIRAGGLQATIGEADSTAELFLKIP